MIATDRRQDIIEAIEKAESEVVAAMMAEFYQNPFWEARFGEKGRKHTQKDSNYNLRHLITAIAVDYPPSLSEHYRWLRGLLVYRGMCTRHVRETIDLIGRELSARMPDLWPDIALFHDASYAGLAYEHPLCQALEERESEITRAVTHRLLHPAPFQPTGGDSEQVRQIYLRETGYHLSYLIDAVQFGPQAPHLFMAYVTFMGNHLPTIGISKESFHQTLRIMGAEIDLALPIGRAEPALQLLHDALTTVPTTSDR